MTPLYDDPPATPAATPLATPLGYAVPAGGGPSPVWAGFWVLAGGLALVFLGGCFCLGILVLVTGAATAGYKPLPPPVSTGRGTVLMVVLYAAALACFVAGASLVVMATRKLLAVGRV